MITDQAFAQLNNAYAWRGRVRKRFGSRWIGNTQLSTRLRMTVATISAGSASGTVPGGKGAIGQLFSIGTNIFTVYQLGGAMTALLIAGTASTATFNTSTGAFVFTGVAAPDTTPVYWYPALPVMGLLTFENQLVDNTPTIAFDTVYSYQYTGVGWEAITPNNAVANWSGSNAEFFWPCNYRGATPDQYSLFVTNFNKNEANFMRYLDSSFMWHVFNPVVVRGTPNTTMIAARILIPFKRRMLAFNIWEQTGASNVQYAQRMAYSAQGSPIDDSGASYYPWNRVVGLGGAIDCPTTEAIVTVQYVKDRLIVFLDQSTWEIVYTGNEVQPFDWQQINSELGVESSFSVIPFDKIALAIGDDGVIACTGNNVERIDDKIPDEVFNIHIIDSGIARVYGIRDYRVEMVYWTFPDQSGSTLQPYPVRILVYNYKNGTWAFNDDSITCFGYFQIVNGISWSDEFVEWADEVLWSDGSLQTQAKNILAGNQEGWTFLIEAEETINAPALQITNITTDGFNIVTVTCIDHNLRAPSYDLDQIDYIYLQDIVASGNLTLLNGSIQSVVVIVDKDTFQFVYNQTDPLNPIILEGIYDGNGSIARVSNIQLLTKQYNFYMQQGRNAYVSKIDFLVDATQNGQIQVDYYVSTNVKGMIAESSPATGTGSLLGTGILETFPYPTVPFESDASQLWHPYYLQADGEFIQLNMQMNNQQMLDPLIRQAGFQLHAMTIYAVPSSSRLQ